jgi:prepilin-type N-terminal cleavage/methylation domain-containing protein
MKLMKKGFTLIELLVTIAIVAVLAAAVLVAINPQDKIYSANDSTVQADVAAIATASSTYATANSGFYPATIAQLVPGELTIAPTAPTGYSAYSLVAAPSGCTGGTTCTSVVVTGQVKSTRLTATAASPKFWRYESSTNKSCIALTATTACP